MQISVQIYAPTALSFGKIDLSTHCIRAWVDHKAGQNVVGKVINGNI
jgi:hypothetical protein